MTATRASAATRLEPAGEHFWARAAFQFVKGCEDSVLELCDNTPGLFQPVEIAVWARWAVM